MLKEYSIADILSRTGYIPYYVGTFEATDDPDIEWAHRHSFYSLVWFTEGSGFYVIDFQEYEIKPQRLFLVNTKQIHNWDYSSNSKGYILMLDAPIGAELGINTIASFADIHQSSVPVLENCFKNLLCEYDINDDLSYSNIKIGIGYLYSIIRRITAQSTNVFQSNSLMDKLRMLVVQEESHLLPVEEYAERLQISVDELSQICKKHTGVSLKQYILAQKITEAKRLLLFGKLNINELAYQLGFEDASYFSRIFKKKTTLTPTAFSEKYRKQD